MYIIFKGSSLNIVLVAKTGDQVQPLHYWIGRNQNRQPTSLNAFLPYDKIGWKHPLKSSNTIISCPKIIWHLTLDRAEPKQTTNISQHFPAL